MVEAKTLRCPGCNAPSHPSSGCAYTPTCVYCWSCTLAFARWLERWTHGKGRRKGLCFYDYVGRSDGSE